MNGLAVRKAVSMVLPRVGSKALLTVILTGLLTAVTTVATKATSMA